MANHKSAEKRIRANEAKQDRNKYQAKTMRNALKNLRSTKDQKASLRSSSGSFFNARQIGKEECDS